MNYDSQKNRFKGIPHSGAFAHPFGISQPVEKNNGGVSHCSKVNLSESKRISPDWERDPVCGEIINFNDAKGVSIFKSSKYYFCGHKCINTFEDNPSAYADKDEEDEDFIYFEDSNNAANEQFLQSSPSGQIKNF